MFLKVLFLPAVVLLCCAVLLGATEAFAGGDAFAPIYIQQTNKHTTRMVTAAEVLKSKHQAEWADTEQQEYLANALWSVYSAVFAYSLLHGELPSDLHSVVDEGLLSVWPDNPYDNWEPMQVNVSSTSFSAGNFSLQLCPASAYSYSGHGTEVPLSFELGIFGPSEEFALDYGHAEAYEKNSGWATVPSGTLYMIGGWTESVADSQAKLAAESESSGASQ